MRDPYHSARVRFKVARDRCIEYIVTEEQRAALFYMVNEMYGDEQVREHREHLGAMFTLECCAEMSTQDGFTHECEYELKEAAGIMMTMQKWKVTDERQALLLWKLSRD